MAISTKANVQMLSYDIAILLLESHPRELSAYVSQKACLKMSLTAYF